jgi:hypothetical protein
MISTLCQVIFEIFLELKTAWEKMSCLEHREAQAETGRSKVKSPAPISAKQYGDGRGLHFVEAFVERTS